MENASTTIKFKNFKLCKTVLYHDSRVFNYTTFILGMCYI